MISKIAITNQTTVLLSILTLIIAAAAFFRPIVKGLYTRFFRGPKLIVDVKFHRKMESPVYEYPIVRQINNKRTQINPINCVVSYIITIENHSELIAYNLQMAIVKSPLEMKFDGSKLPEPLDYKNPKTIIGEIAYNYDRGSGSVDPFNRKLNELEILLSYKNERGSTFYTLFKKYNDNPTNKLYPNPLKMFYQRQS